MTEEINRNIVDIQTVTDEAAVEAVRTTASGKSPLELSVNFWNMVWRFAV